MFADAAELMGRCGTGNNRIVIHLDVAGESHRIRQDHMAADLAIMGDVRIAKKQIVRTDSGHGIRVGTSMNRGVFTENIVIADFKISGIAHVFEILGFSADGGKGEKLIATAKPRVAINDDMRVEDAIVSKRDICANDTKRPDADIASQRGER